MLGTIGRRVAERDHSGHCEMEGELKKASAGARVREGQLQESLERR